MNIIVNADKNWAIGKNNSLLVRIPADMKYFRQMTEGNIVVMGRKTLESFPQGRRTDHVYEADTWFPDLEKDPDWQKTAETDEQTYFDLEYVFAKYERIK